MANVNNLKKGMALLIDNEVYLVLDFQHVKPGKGGAFVRVKLKNAKIGTIVDKRFNGGENVEDVYLEEKVLEYMYNDGNSYVFMDHGSYEQVYLSEDVVGDAKNFLKENTEVRGRFHGEEIMSLQLPTSMELKITYTEPGFKGNTASGNALKPATLETGAVVNVPMFINEGEVIIVNTETSSYIGRA